MPFNNAVLPVENLPEPILSPILSSSYGMSHSRIEIEVWRVAIQDEEPVSSTEAVESWLSSLKAVLADPDDPEVPELVLHDQIEKWLRFFNTW